MGNKLTELVGDLDDNTGKITGNKENLEAMKTEIG